MNMKKDKVLMLNYLDIFILKSALEAWKITDQETESRLKDEKKYPAIHFIFPGTYKGLRYFSQNYGLFLKITSVVCRLICKWLDGR